MTTEEMTRLRADLIALRNECFGPSREDGKGVTREEVASQPFDAAGLVILSEAIRWLAFRIEGRPFEPLT